VSQRRELAEAECLCVASLRGDARAVQAMLRSPRCDDGDDGGGGGGGSGSDSGRGDKGGGEGSGSDDRGDSDDHGEGDYREGGVPWDAEDRFGVTAGEYALAAGHSNVFEALVAAGGRDIARRMTLGVAAAMTAGAGISVRRRSASGEGGEVSADATADATAAGRNGWGYLRAAASYGEGGCLLDGAKQPVWTTAILRRLKRRQHALQQRQALEARCLTVLDTFFFHCLEL